MHQDSDRTSTREALDQHPRCCQAVDACHVEYMQTTNAIVNDGEAVANLIAVRSQAETGCVTRPEPGIGGCHELTEVASITPCFFTEHLKQKEPSGVFAIRNKGFGM